MGHVNQFLTLLSIAFLWLFCDKANGIQSDVDCLRSLFKSINDPYGYLNTTWNFNNKTEGSICSFSGVECWHPDENKVLNIKLVNMGLKGPFPRGLKNCSSLTGLDLSNNHFSGTIPSDISTIVKYVTSLDLSSNEFTGEIPADISNCTYLNVLKLDDNQLSGQIPPQLSLFSRLKTFSVANNFLTGPVPNISAARVEDYANNTGLCGKPLPACASLNKGTNANTIVAAAVGGVTASAVIVGAVLIFLFRRAAVRRKVQDPEGNNWTKSLKGSKGIQVSLFKKSVSKMKLGDLMKATNNFSKDNIIGSERTGAMYKAVLQDGTLMMCKRLQESQHSEDEFKAEMTTIGGVNHQNLVPLLGYCIAKKERILLYKYMENGTLHDSLHPKEEEVDAVKPLIWSQRLKIAIGAARGLAWLHHNCNPRILHRNISSKCILLDGEFEAKISDFGLARLMNPVDTHLSTFVNGEFGDLGYVAPEYARTLVATPKGDVYSFGVVLLELVTSERPTQVSRAPESFKGNLVEWIMLLSDESKLNDAIDKFLMGKGVDNEIFQVLKIGCNCVLPSVAKERPTMFEVYQLLRAIGQPYNFSVENEAMVPTDSGDAPWQELIVARDIAME